MGNEGTEGSGEWGSSATGHIRPADVQQKQFRTARLGGGYRMREVDEFLDQITDALSSLIAENERLRRAQGGSPAPASAPVAVGAADRGAIDAFLQREKGFLQSLGGLVQSHAEDLKSMVGSARAAPARQTEPAAAEGAATAPALAEAEPSAEARPETSDETPVPVAAAAGAQDADEHLAERDVAEEIGAPDQHDEADEPVAAVEPTGSVAEGDLEEPIRLDEPEPARARRTDESGAGSLRELFWGEE